MHSSRVNLQHRPFLTPIWVTAGAVAAGTVFFLALFLVWFWGAMGSTTLIVVPAAPAGDVHAAELSRMFSAEQGHGRLDAIYIANPGSNASVTALASKFHIPVRDAAGWDAGALARQALHEAGGGRVLIVAAPELFQAVVKKLSGADDVPPIEGGDYGAVYIVTVPRIGHANLVRLNY